MSQLDRLGAIVEGLAPQIRILAAGPLDGVWPHRPEPYAGLVLTLVLDGSVRWRTTDAVHTLEAPAVIASAASVTAELAALDGQPPRVLCAELRFEGPASGQVLAAFERPLLLTLADSGDDLRHLLALIRSEVEQVRCGRGVLLERAGGILLIALLRHVIARPGLGSGVLRALADPRLAHAIVAMHEAPAKAWSLERLADRAGMSRTAFASAFRNQMGCTPGHYLGDLRLAIAERHIARGEGLKRAAGAAGYASTAALSRALARRRLRLTAPPSGAPAPH
ncbi:MAG: helix-turn-helix transcriptional regulator [Rhodocyclaceae bacterium]|nr:helix-turn-helix transcriptional regulator [Rhodocyclaceae bacterium]